MCGVYLEYFTFREKYKPVQDIPLIILNASEKPSRLFVLRHNVPLIDLFRGSSFGEWRQRNKNYADVFAVSSVEVEKVTTSIN